MKKENINFKRLMTFAIVATMCLVVVPTVSADTPTEMVAYWGLDEGSGSTAEDETTNANDGTLSGGRFGNALKFDGVDDKVDFGDIDVMDGLSALTISLWVKPESLSNLKSLVSKYSRTYGGWIIETSFDAAGGANDLIFAPTDIAGHDWGYTSEDVLSVGVWTHVVMVYDGSGVSNTGKLKGYIDGDSKTLTFNDDIPSSLPSSTDPVYIGACIDDGRYFNGIIDEVGIWNRALTATEVQQLFQGAFNDDTGLVAFWHLDESVGTTAYDETTYSNQGAITGATWAGPTWTTGKVGPALCFDGIDDYVEVPDDPTLDITGDITLEAWIYINGFDASTDYHLYVIGKDNVGQRSYGIGVNRVYSGQYHKPYFVVFQDVGYSVCWGDYALVINQWYHMAGVYDATSDALELYINGVPQTDDTATGTTYLGTADLRIGGRAYTGSECYFNGIIDEAAIYNSPLSADEISKHYCLGQFGLGYCENLPSLTYTGGLVFSTTTDVVLEATLKDSGGSGMSEHSVTFYIGTDSYTVITDDDGIASKNIGPMSVGVYEVYAEVYCLQSDPALLTVYDPEVGTGFITGGGWIYSEAGAYKPDLSLEGKANFGFVSKYKKGQSTPDGNTEFKFKAGDLNFHSDDYDWLVITQHKAIYKGTGTVNGEGPYKFMITAIDSGVSSDPNDVDTFRIKIWEEDEFGVETVTYDNGPGTLLGGGQIKIHNN